MNLFWACLAFGPLGIYLMLLGVIHLSRRPLVTTGTRETLALGLALLGLAVVGPMQLFMPEQAAVHFGPYVWLLLMAFYGLCLALVLLLARPRLVVYNVRMDELRLALDAAVRRLDPETVWSSRTLSLPLSRVHLQMEPFVPLANVTLSATSDDQSITAWRRLEGSLRQTLQEVPTAAGPHGFWLLACGMAILTTLGWWVADSPQTIAQGLANAPAVMLHTGALRAQQYPWRTKLFLGVWLSWQPEAVPGF